MLRYEYDHDFHIHSKLSSCSRDEGQTSERILQYAKQNNLKSICLTDHFWDDAIDGASSWYKAQNFEHISQARPLPQAEGIEFLFGCETEMDKFYRLGISKDCIDMLDFVVVPTTHLHMDDFTISLEDFNSYERRANIDDDNTSYVSQTGYSSSYAKTFLKENKPTAKIGGDYSAYRSGVKVKHAKFGIGTIIVVKGSGENVIVDVAFKGIGIKSLSVKYAPMEIING